MRSLFHSPTVTAAIFLVLFRKSVVLNAQNASYPSMRFVPWSQNEALLAAETLGYNSTSWDNPGQNPIEGLTYELVAADRASLDALEVLRIDEQSWDCYINHFRGYTWPNLPETYKNAYRALGWDHIWWNRISDPPESERFAWDMLNSDEQDAAATLCYFEELWDSVPIYAWTNKNLNSTVTMIPSTYPVSTTVPSSTPSVTGNMSPSSKPVTTTSTPVSIIDNTANPISVEATNPSSSPSLVTNMPSRIVLSASLVPTMLPTTQLTIPIPYFRYIPWSKLDDDTRILAILLGYTQDAWDLPGLAALEHMSFDMIKSSNMSRQIVYIQALGFTKPSWDCYMAHYRAHSWEKLSDYNVQQYYETLGWTESIWNSSDAPSTELLSWNDLNIAERIAAESLCYFEPTWNNISLQDNLAWRASPSLSSSYSMISVSWATFTTTFVASATITRWNALFL